MLISTRETAVKTRNLARDPRASLCVLNDGFFGEWIQAEGTAEIIHLPEAMEMLVGLLPARSPASTRTGTTTGPPCERERRVIVRITMTRAGPDISG